MNDGIMLSEKSKEELIEIILEERKQREELEEKIKELEEKVKAEQQKRVAKFSKANTKKRKKRPGRKKGHVGITRHPPEEIDEVIEETVEECPCCQGELVLVDVEEEVQEDIVPAYVRVRKYRRYVYGCENCKNKVHAPYHPEHVPKGYLGANVLIQAAILGYYHCLPYRKICELFEDMAGLKISPGGVSQALARISEWIGVEKDDILEAIRGSPQVHCDETGWRLDGKRNWLWALVNKRLAYYKIDRSRRKKVIQELLGEDFKGTLISDFYAVYLKLPYDMQKCLVHVLRDFHTSAKADKSKEFASAHKKIKRIIKDAVRLQSRYETLPKGKYTRLRVRIEDRLFDFMAKGYRNKNLQRLSKRFAQSWMDMLRFLKDPSLDWHNNFAERMIRPNVIYRNRSFGNRSDRGAEAHGTMMSIMQTLRLQGKNVSKNLRQSYLHHRQADAKGERPSFLSLGTC